jgi:hypothetical protein
MLRAAPGRRRGCGIWGDHLRRRPPGRLLIRYKPAEGFDDHPTSLSRNAVSALPARAQVAGGTPSPPAAEAALLATWLDRRLLSALLRDGLAPPGATAPPVLDLPGLSVTAEAVHALLRAPDGEDDPAQLEAAASGAWQRLMELPGGVLVRLTALGLDAFALKLLALCLAPDLDARYARIYGFVHDDLTRRRASRALLCRMLDRTDRDGAAFGQALAVAGPLRRLGLMRAVEGEMASALADLDAEPVILCAISGDLPTDLDSMVRREPWPGAETGALATPSPLDAGRALAEPAPGSKLLLVVGEHVSERHGWAEALLMQLRAAPLRLELPETALTDVRAGETLGRRLGLLAWLEGAVPIIDLPTVWQTPEARRAVASMLAPLAALAPLVVLLAEAGWVAPSLPAFTVRHQVRLRALTGTARRAAWRELATAHQIVLQPTELDLLAALTLGRSEIAQALGEAEALTWPERRPDAAALLAAGRRLASAVAPRFARRLPPELGLDRIVLPPDRHAQLREIVVQVRCAEAVQEGWGFRDLMLYGRGVTALFAGPSGTGKTLSARAIAGELGIDLLQIDLAQVVSKYIGETEKNLSAVFAAAQASGLALLFDEAEALFGKRNEVRDAHDRYANIETAFLLQRIEEFTGLVILTTNLRPNLDTGFLRRLQFVIDFPRPDAALRSEIWRRAFPPRAPLEADLDLDLLAERLDLTGGSIQAAALRAAYLAAGEGRSIAMRHVVYACRRELLKHGQLSAERELAALAAQLAERGSP